MKYYRRKRYSDKKTKKIALRILFVLFAAAVITVFAVFLGNHVKGKVEAAEERIKNAETAQTNNDAPPSSVLFPLELSADRPVVSAMGADPFAEDALEPLSHERKEAFDTVSVRVTAEGRLIYTSPAMLTLARVPEDDGLWGKAEESYGRLKEFCTLRKSEGMRLSAVMEASVFSGELLWENDRVLAAELAELGFDEVIVTGFGEITAKNAEYLSRLSSVEADVGAVFPVEEYLSTENENLFRTLLSSNLLLCADFGDKGEEEIKELCTELRSIIESHCIRAFIDNSDMETVRTELAALRAGKVRNIHIASSVGEDFLTTLFPTEAETEGEETLTEEETVSVVNPYAVTETEAETTDPGWF